MNEDSTIAYLFQSDDSDLFAVTIDEVGLNLPREIGLGSWQLQMAFPLGVREPMPRALNPEPVLRGIRNVGYYIWQEGKVRNPSGTSQ